MANIAEGFDSQSDQEFAKFLIYSRRSASETQSHLYVALDQQYIEQNQFDHFYQLLIEIKKIIQGLINYLVKSPKSTVDSQKLKQNSDFGLTTNDFGLSQ